MRQNKIRLLEHPFWGVTIVHCHRVLIKKLSLFPFWALFIFIYKAQSWTTLVSCPTRRAGCSSCTAPWTRTSTSCSTQPSSSTSSSNTANPTNYRWVVSISVSHTFLSLFLFLFLSCYSFIVTFSFKQTHSHPLFNPKRYHTTGSFLAEL